MNFIKVTDEYDQIKYVNIEFIIKMYTIKQGLTYLEIINENGISVKESIPEIFKMIEKVK